MRGGINRVHLDPFGHAVRGDVLPGLAAVLRHVHQPVVAAHPKYARALGRFRHREDGVVVFDACIVLGDDATSGPLLRLIVAREVQADGHPGLALIRGLEQDVAGRVEHLGVVRRKHDGEVPLEAILHAFRAVTHGVIGIDSNYTGFTGAMIVARQQAAIGTGVYDVGVARIRRNPPAFATAHGPPVALGNPIGSCAAGDADGGVVLLSAVDVIGKVVIRNHAIELCGCLVLRGPALAAVQAHIGAAIVALHHAAAVIGRNPEVMIVAVGRFDGCVRAPTIV